MYTGPESRQVCAGRKHQHVGVPNGDNSTLAAAAEQYPNYQGKQERPNFLLAGRLGSVPLTKASPGLYIFSGGGRVWTVLIGCILLGAEHGLEIPDKREGGKKISQNRVKARELKHGRKTGNLDLEGISPLAHVLLKNMSITAVGMLP